ncbi:MAG TPA: aspartate-semialdehyde dehydrogenase [Syntrophomonadaceae bacterium]|nr:aspartate-semialdehyde dehydrogenase [Syntrophomonadaceae bacterium]
MAHGIRLAIVGATGAVGQEMMKILEERNFPVKELICLAAPQEAGTKLRFKGEELTVKSANAEAFKGVDIALFAVGSDVAEVLAPLAKKNNCLVIDNSNAFRLVDEVPLIVPEVNAEDIKLHKGIIASPNCSTTIMVVAINPIYQAFGLKRVVVSTYQAVSGAGKAGLDELNSHSQAYHAGEEVTPEVFQHPIAFNLIPHIDEFVDNDYTKEEMKMVWETRKIMHIPDLKVSATAVRVPVHRSHSESINLDLEKPATVDEVRQVLKNAPGVIVQDDIKNNIYPMPLYTSNKDEIYVGRIRKDISGDNSIAIWVASDQIRKGAATNTIQIAEIVVEKNLY